MITYPVCGISRNFAGGKSELATSLKVLDRVFTREIRARRNLEEPAELPGVTDGPKYPPLAKRSPRAPSPEPFASRGPGANGGAIPDQGGGFPKKLGGDRPENMPPLGRGWGGTTADFIPSAIRSAPYIRCTR